ncbi:hypothetical protein GCM10010329_33920 [Streptomyces spiroverticillatus]|uniref:Uncharacterized protein n=1 Tax=Streptomyces finlayi TaxID=67296 RepID=A0A918WWY6_9ACTN|nr:hypothetical protein [Streptomyces finlayi]GHA08361.1 hypothetical protein GCM10010329_33920 [Streptomyces spiroverticillatus]GHC91374.1 hypothetical protein GCM10010334_26330 [Streptomyces finlayi]
MTTPPNPPDPPAAPASPFGPTAYDLLGLAPGADAKAVRAARLKGMADPERRADVSRAANALARPSGRLKAALLTPLLGALSEEELTAHVDSVAYHLVNDLPLVMLEPDRFGPFPRSDS